MISAIAKRRSEGERVEPFQYIDFDINNSECIHVMISDRAFAAILAEVAANGRDETGGVLIGNIWNRVWYIVEASDGGIETSNTPEFFSWSTEYVNHIVQKHGALYHFPLTILGVYHRHPGEMDHFSNIDEKTMHANVKLCRHGMLSMLVNIDPEFRLSFFYCNNDTLMPVEYDVGDEYLPTEILQLGSPEELIARHAKKPFSIKPHKVMDPNHVPKHVILPSDRPKTAEPMTEAVNNAKPMPAESDGEAVRYTPSQESSVEDMIIPTTAEDENDDLTDDAVAASVETVADIAISENEEEGAFDEE